MKKKNMLKSWGASSKSVVPAIIGKKKKKKITKKIMPAVEPSVEDYMKGKA